MTIFYIDSMSYYNLGIYDTELLNHINSAWKIIFIGNTKLGNHVKLSEPIQFLPLFNYSDKKGLFKAISYISSLFQIIWKIIVCRPSIIHVQWFRLYSVDLLFIKLIKRIAATAKIIHTAHNLLPHNSEKKHEKIFRKLYRNCHHIIVHTEVTKDELKLNMGVSDEKVSVIPHGMLAYTTIEKLDKPSDTGDVIRFGFFGKLNSYKGIDIMIDAWTDTDLSQDCSVHLYIVGMGDHPSLQKAERKQNITIINRFVSDEEFAKYLQLMDIVILPYRQISQSGVLLSALYHHKRIIVSRTGGLIQPFTITDVGWVLEKLSAEALHLTIRKALEDQHAVTNWQLIDRFYSWQRIGKMTSELYMSLSGDDNK